MRYKRKYFMFVAVWIALPPSGFAEAAEPAAQSAISQSTGSDKAAEEPLFLSLSLSLSRFSLSPPPLTQFTQQDEITGRKASEELSCVPLLLTLSPLSQLIAKNGRDNAPAIEKPDSRSDDISSREMLFGSTEPVKAKLPTEPAWKQLVTGWHGFSQLEIADTYSSPEHLS